ncbi:DUF7660 family protein [Streptomyces sp. NBC_01808]|uniref:DUF7660 family protein n=1 Tax=Streptomyces sp. NBC_01808 TaxID=2975947 RepID=UPI003FA37C57
MAIKPPGEIPDRQAFVPFIEELRADYEANGHEWENPALERFLEALGAWGEGAHGWRYARAPGRRYRWTGAGRFLSTPLGAPPFTSESPSTASPVA